MDMRPTGCDSSGGEDDAFAHEHRKFVDADEVLEMVAKVKINVNRRMSFGWERS